MFLRASCGCIVLDMEWDGQRIVVDPCDRDRYYSDDDGGPTFLLRDLSDKSFEPLSSTEQVRYRRLISNELGNGARFRKIQSLLKGR